MEMELNISKVQHCAYVMIAKSQMVLLMATLLLLLLLLLLLMLGYVSIVVLRSLSWESSCPALELLRTGANSTGWLRWLLQRRRSWQQPRQSTLSWWQAWTRRRQSWRLLRPIWLRWMPSSRKCRQMFKPDVNWMHLCPVYMRRHICIATDLVRQNAHRVHCTKCKHHITSNIDVQILDMHWIHAYCCQRYSADNLLMVLQLSVAAVHKANAQHMHWR